MRQVAKKGLLTAMATGSVLASTAGYAYAAGSDAQGAAAGSPGVGSGNAVQAPVDIPVNACGNTINVIGLLNPAFGNNCGNTSGAHTGGSHTGSGSHAGSSASGSTTGSPGVASGNNVQAPINAPVDACGNSVNVVGIGNPAFGNDCGNHAAPHHKPPTTPPGDDCPPGHPGDRTPPATQTPPGTGSTGGNHTPPATETPGGTNGTPRTGGGTPDSGVVPASSTTTTATPRTVDTAAAETAAGDRLASTGVSGLELLAPTGALLLIGGGVLYRRSRVSAGV
ncbi:chaplin family protein [Kitasatospora sp. NPDC048365]|uniref:chaplin n=1 Tax=Kitasatospora sp. NPDC048365 TaxID=3364050 RepID=UPI0037101B0E